MRWFVRRAGCADDGPTPLGTRVGRLSIGIAAAVTVSRAVHVQTHTGTQTAQTDRSARVK